LFSHGSSTHSELSLHEHVGAIVGVIVGDTDGWDVVGLAEGETDGDTVGWDVIQSELHCQKSTSLHVTLCAVPTVHEVQTDAIAVPSTQGSGFVHVSGLLERYI